MAQPRAIWRQVFINFFNSFRTNKKVLIGKDHYGSEYYEFERKVRGKNTRWCIPAEYDNFQQEIPAEWEAWLRHRRQDPPTEEEIERNRIRMITTINNAKKFEKPVVKQANTVPDGNFPVYSEFEEEPGMKRGKSS